MSESKRRRWDSDGAAPTDGEAGAKKARFGAIPGQAGNGAGATATAPAAPAGGNGVAPTAAIPKLTVSLGALEKAKKALELKKQLQDKLKKLPIPPAGAAAGVNAAQAAAAAPGAAALPPPPKPPTARPAPLRLDEFGREIDEHGKVIERPKQAVATLKVNQKAEARPGGAQGVEVAEGPAAQGAAAASQADTQFFDPFLGNRGLKRLERRPKAAFHFFEPGRLQKQAERGRLRAQYGDDDVKALRARKEAERRALAEEPMDVNLIPLGQKAPAPAEEPEPQPEQQQQQQVPDVEWWDARLLPNKSYDDVMGGQFQVLDERISSLVEHPVLIEPPAEGPPPAPQPLKLTKKELKKLRTQRRLAREQEKQELMRQGLLEAPKPKVKISNLMRVLGAEATADPTAIEQEVRKQMAERQQAHDDRNLARKLTPAEKRDKKANKLFNDDDGQTHVAVYKVGSMKAPQNRFKVDINAQENHMTGACVITDQFGLVVVEGCTKSQRRYEKLMLRRINWQLTADGDEEASVSAGTDRQPNYCHLVWQGVALEPAFKKFQVEEAASDAAARKFMEESGVAHYYDLAKNFASS